MAQDAAPFITPHANDVLLGKGNIINSHPGNRQFRVLVDSQKQAFAATKQKKVKRAMAAQIVNEIAKLQPPGRFLVEDQSRPAKNITNVDSDPHVHPIIMEKIWIIVKPEKALSKVMHRLREREKEIDQSEVISCDQVGTEYWTDDTYLDQVRGETQLSQAVKAVDFLLRPISRLCDFRRDSFTGPLLDDTVSITNQNATAEKGTLDIDITLSKYLEGYLDFESDADSASRLDLNESQHLCEYTLRQWVMSSKPDFSFNAAASFQSSVEVRKRYIKSALLIALKLTECILEAEKDEHNGRKNPIPLASIAPENVLIRAKFEGISAHPEETEEIIEFAWVMSFMGDDSATGGVDARLFAMGKVFYDLFSMGMLVEESQLTSMRTIDRSDEAESDHRLQKKSHWRSAKSDDNVSNWITTLDSYGVPWSLCALVNNLLECRHGSCNRDDAYTSFSDLKLDLQLMVDNPSCFLDNIQVSYAPKIEFPDKLYGRDDELRRLKELYTLHRSGEKINGAIISGRAGVGKTALAMHMQMIAIETNGYFISAKFEQNQMCLKPLATISILFDSLCEKIFNDSSQSELKVIEDDLTSTIGIQSTILEVVPGLKKLMPSSLALDSFANNCVDFALSMRYTLGEVMRVILSHSKPVTLFIDDIQFADDASLQLIGYLILSTQGARSFFTCCHREDEVSTGGSFEAWITSVSMFSLEAIFLKPITSESVNNLISETLRLSPRITRPLSSVLHCKTRGNPLFLRQLLDSLIDQRIINMDMRKHRWVWDLGNIINLKISTSVLTLLTKEIEKLPSDLQWGLQVASCLGSCLTEPILCCISNDLGHDIKPILQQACQKGFILEMNDSSMFCFAHDKIQEAVYELMDDEHRRKHHMRFGLALYNHTLNDCAENDDMFFAAVNQINHGGPGSVHEPSQMNVFAKLNLKAGRRAIDLSDYHTAFKFFQCGISYLGENKWTLNYQLSIELYDAVSGAAFVLNNLDAVTLYSNEVISHARSFDDKLVCLCNATKILMAHRPEEAMETSFEILLQFGELLPRTMEEYELRSGIDKMNFIILSMSDDTICNLHENKSEKRCTLFNLYENMSHYLQYFKPWLFSSVSLRMIELTMKDGLSAKSPFAFANFGSVLMSSGHVSEGYRLGKLALKLVEKKGSFQHKASIVSIVYDLIFWASEPLPSIVEALLIGHNAGQQSGDITIALKNRILSILNCYAAGQSLDAVQRNILDFISNIHGLEIFLASPVLLLSQITILRDGLNAVQMDNLPSEREILSDTRSGPSISTAGKIYHLTRSFLFHQLDILPQIDISTEVTKNCHQLNTDVLMGYFFEGLASFQLARRSKFEEAATWVERGLSALVKMRGWSEHSVWNWESKMLLLEAENLFTEGIHFDSAGSFYDRAIQSAHAHKFIHEEAIASELAGTFYHERGFREKSYSYFVHSIKSYEKWGAHAVAKRVECDVLSKFGSDIHQLASFADASLEYLFATSPGSSNKHRLVD